MTLSANFTSKSVFDQQGCRALTFALARLSCIYNTHSHVEKNRPVVAGCLRTNGLWRAEEDTVTQIHTPGTTVAHPRRRRSDIKAGPHFIT